MVLADSMYGESGSSRQPWHAWGISYVVAIRSNHHVRLFPGERVRQTCWRPFDRVFTDGTSEQRYRWEFVFGQRTRVRFFVITTDPVRLPPETTWHLMTNLPGKIEQTVGNTFGLRTWIEYGFKQAKDELVWADSRLTDAASIERWWELVLCTYVLVSLQAPALAAAPADEPTAAAPGAGTPAELARHLDHPTLMPGPRIGVGTIGSLISACYCSPLSAPASCSPGFASIPSHTSPRASPTSAHS